MRKIDRRGQRLGGVRYRLGLVPAIAVGAAACVTTWATHEAPRYHRTAAVEGATDLVGEDECEVCHEEVNNHPDAPDYHSDCEACHGSGELHIDSEEIAEIRYPANADCESCHETGSRTLLGWTTSEHAQTGVLCSDCHDVHNREPWHVRGATELEGVMLSHAAETSRMCAGCHAEVAARFDLPSHHPIREGMLRCTDCHPPHREPRVTLGARTQLCTGCHQDYAGPWIWEHAPVAEDCRLCHVPHGASAQSLLEPTQPGSCISCHSLAAMGALHDPWALLDRCTDCHSAIHGSYTDPHLMR